MLTYRTLNNDEVQIHWPDGQTHPAKIRPTVRRNNIRRRVVRAFVDCNIANTRQRRSVSIRDPALLRDMTSFHTFAQYASHQDRYFKIFYSRDGHVNVAGNPEVRILTLAFDGGSEGIPRHLAHARMH